MRAFNPNISQNYGLPVDVQTKITKSGNMQVHEHFSVKSTIEGGLNPV